MGSFGTIQNNTYPGQASGQRLVLSSIPKTSLQSAQNNPFQQTGLVVPAVGLPISTNQMSQFQGTRDQFGRIQIQPPQTENGIMALGIIKTLVGGLIVGGTVATAKKLKLPYMVAIDMALGLGETFFAKWIMHANNPVSKWLLEKSSRFSKAKNIPPEKMTYSQKEMALTPISAIASILSALGTYGIGNWLEEKPFMKAKHVTNADLETAKGIKKPIIWLQTSIHELAGKLKVPEHIAKHPAYRIAWGHPISKTIVAALVVGVMEGLLARWLQKHEEKNEQMGKTGLAKIFSFS